MPRACSNRCVSTARPSPPRAVRASLTQKAPRTERWAPIHLHKPQRPGARIEGPQQRTIAPSARAGTCGPRSQRWRGHHQPQKQQGGLAANQRSQRDQRPPARGGSSVVPKRRPGDVHQKCQSRPQPLHGAQDGEAAGWFFQVQVASRRPEPAPPTNCATRCAASRDLRQRGKHGHDPQTCQQHHHKVGMPGRLLQEAAEGGAEPWCMEPKRGVRDGV